MAEIRKSYSSDAATYNGGFDLQAIGGNAAETLYSGITNKKAARPTVITKTAADSTADISAPGTLIPLGNSMHVMVNIHFTTGTNSCTVCLGKYDNAGTPALIGITDSVAVAAQGTYRNGAAGKYVSSHMIFDVGDACNIFVFLPSLTTAEDVDIYVTVL